MTLFIESKMSTLFLAFWEHRVRFWTNVCPNTIWVSITQPFIHIEHQEHATNPLHTPKTPLQSNRHNGISPLIFICTVCVLVHRTFEISTCLVNLPSPELPTSWALPTWKALSKQWAFIKAQNGCCLCALLFLVLNCLLIAGLVLAKVMNVS